MIVKVFDIDTKVVSNSIDETQEKNILKIFDELTKETHLITNCFLDLRAPDHQSSPIFYFEESEDKENFDYKKIADDLLNAEIKADNTRNSTIREGLLFIKATDISITIMKLEKLTVIDKDTYGFKSELGKEKDYFKVCTFEGNFNDVKIIDKNRTAAKYWYQRFLGLSRTRTSEVNTEELVSLISKDELFLPEINEKENYDEIKRFTEYYLFDNKKFDKSDLFNELTSSGLVELTKEDELFSDESKKIDSDFDINEKALNKEYERKIQATDEITITTKNIKESMRDNDLSFDEENKNITIIIDDDYLIEVKEMLENE